MIYVRTTSPDGQTFQKFIIGFPALRAEFLQLGKSLTPTIGDQALIAQGLPARVLTEVGKPGLEFGQAATYTAELQPDGTWLQVWQISIITLPEAKSQLISLARGVLATFVSDLSAAEMALVGEVFRGRIDPTPTGSDYPIISAIAADRSITLPAAFTYAAELVDAWVAKAAQYVPTYLDVIDRIQAVSAGPTAVQQCKDIYDELAGFIPS